MNIHTIIVESAPWPWRNGEQYTIPERLRVEMPEAPLSTIERIKALQASGAGSDKLVECALSESTMTYSDISALTGLSLQVVARRIRGLRLSDKVKCVNEEERSKNACIPAAFARIKKETP